jgi:tRNA(His) 5'-end guanylyltransferase
MKQDSLGDRMKDYEQRAYRQLLRRSPLLLRLDGKAFHSWTKGLARPFDFLLKQCMDYTMYKLCSEIEGARFGYTQSDEISILVCDYQDISTQAWFDYRANKIESVAASICTAAFNQVCLKLLPEQYKKKGPAIFDARAWNLPKEEVTNYFYWRQRDCEKNSVSQVAMVHFSHKQLMGKNGSQKQDMLMLEKGINWNDIPTFFKRGSAIYKIHIDFKGTLRSKWVVDYEMPVISKDRDYVEKWVIDVPVLTTVDLTKSNLFDGSALTH